MSENMQQTLFEKQSDQPTPEVGVQLDRLVSKPLLLNGDCLELMKGILDGSVDMILTDPPYGTTACKWDTCIPFEPMWEQLKRITKKNGAIVLFGSQPFTSALVMSNPKMFKYEMVWDKTRGSDFLNANRKPLGAHENMLVFYEKLPTYNPQHWFSKPYKRTPNGTLSDNYGTRDTAYSESLDGKRCPLTIISMARDGDRIHPTQKPVALMEYLIKTYTNENETVLDFTMGSGTTGLACKNLGRNFIGIELDDNYYQIATKRIEG